MLKVSKFNYCSNNYSFSVALVFTSFNDLTKILCNQFVKSEDLRVKGRQTTNSITKSLKLCVDERYYI